MQRLLIFNLAKRFTPLVLGLLLVLNQPKVFAQTPQNKIKQYHVNGKLKLKGAYKNQQKQGVWCYYNDKGVIEKKEYYKADTLTKSQFYVNGRLEKTTYKNGKIVYAPNCGCQ